MTCRALLPKQLRQPLRSYPCLLVSSVAFLSVSFSPVSWTSETEEQSLCHQIVSSTGAVQDHVTLCLEALHAFLATQPPEAYAALRKTLHPQKGPPLDRWKAFQPEVFLKRSKVLNKKDYRDFLRQETVTASHAFLGQLQTLRAHLKACSDPAAHQLSTFYEAYINDLLAATPEQREALLQSRAWLIIEGSLPYRIEQPTARLLASRSDYGYPLKANETGNHLVVGYKGVHYKADCGLAPLTPSFEKAFTLCAQTLCPHQLNLSPPSLLLSLHDVAILDLSFEAGLTSWLHAKGDPAVYLKDHPELVPRAKKTKETYFLQGSQTVEGESVEAYLKAHSKLEAAAFDKTHFGFQVVLSLLLQPYDAKADNFILVPSAHGYRFMGIDNDCLFTPLVYQYPPFLLIPPVII